MFVLLPRGNEVTDAAIATALSNFASRVYPLYAYRKAARNAPLRVYRNGGRLVRSAVQNYGRIGNF
ncbi:MAG: hypothetical protein IJQ81_04500 [Oscillibacter sp.]|nr:hypothetical protein [Oscillibacter sp.]